MKRFEWMACVFVGIPCVAAPLFILPVTNIIGGIFTLSCFVMPTVAVNAQFFKEVSEDFFKKDKKDV